MGAWRWKTGLVRRSNCEPSLDRESCRRGSRRTTRERLDCPADGSLPPLRYRTCRCDRATHLPPFSLDASVPRPRGGSDRRGSFRPARTPSRRAFMRPNASGYVTGEVDYPVLELGQPVQEERAPMSEGYPERFLMSAPATRRRRMSAPMVRGQHQGALAPTPRVHARAPFRRTRLPSF